MVEVHIDGISLGADALWRVAAAALPCVRLLHNPHFVDVPDIGAWGQGDREQTSDGSKNLLQPGL